MKTAIQIVSEVNAIGGRLTLAGDKLRTMLPRNCPLELKTAIRANKPEIMVLLKARSLHLSADCGPWLYVARQILVGEFDGADKSTIASLLIGLNAVVKHSVGRQAFDRLSACMQKWSK